MRAAVRPDTPEMTTDPVPEDLRSFILKHIDSIAVLEALLLLRSDRKTWRAVDVAARLYIPEPAAVAVLDHLCLRELVARNGPDYVYAPASAELGKMVDRLADTYSRSLIPVTSIVHDKPRVQQFADAFRIRREPK
jgi:hypothetical protein